MGLAGPNFRSEAAEIDAAYTATVPGAAEENMPDIELEGYTANYKGIKFNDEYVVYWTSCC